MKYQKDIFTNKVSFLFLLFLILFSSIGFPATHIVYTSAPCTAGDFTHDVTGISIQTVIDDGTVAPGDIIYVCSEATNYSDNIIINKSIEIHGFEGQVNITALDDNLPVFYIYETNNSVVSNFTLSGSSTSGIMINNSDYSTILNTICHDNTHNFILLDSSFNSLTENLAYNDVNGSFSILGESSYNNLSFNTARDIDGSCFYSNITSTHSTLKFNTAYNCTNGFSLQGNFTIAINNTAYNNSELGFFHSDLIIHL
ncbi:MAG: right-handed parallel beta-helix repeat-containing protein [Candidatus ainarchaeum sp.]|nr:right-handed parallel beta-helix repeat-containing protein [Candidatus ainarchaeum sp.]